MHTFATCNNFVLEMIVQTGGLNLYQCTLLISDRDELCDETRAELKK
jgi:hypothetical protein